MQMRTVFCKGLARLFSLGISPKVVSKDKKRLEFSDGKAIENNQLEVWRSNLYEVLRCAIDANLRGFN